MNYRTFALTAIVGIGLTLFSVQGWSQSKEEGIRIFNEALKLQKAAETHIDRKKVTEKYEQALRIFEEVGYKVGIGKAASELGNMYTGWDEGGMAVDYHEKALAMARELKDKKEEGVILNSLGNVFSRRRLYGEAVEYYEKSLAIKRELKDKKGEQLILHNLGSVYWYWGQYDKSVEHTEKSLAIAREFKDWTREVNALSSLGTVYWNWRRYDKAVEYYEKELAIWRKLKRKRAEGHHLMILGTVFEDWGRHDQAVKCYEKSLGIWRELKDKKYEGVALDNLGNVFRDWGQYDKAVEYYEKSLATARDLKDMKSEELTLNNLGNVLEDWGKYDKAVEYYEKSLTICRGLKDRLGEGLTLDNLGRVNARRGYHAKALGSFEEGLRIWKEIKGPVGMPLFNMGMLYLDMGQIEQAVRPLVESECMEGLGRLYLMKSDHQKAKGFYEKLLSSAEKRRYADDLFTAYMGLGWAYQGLGHEGIPREFYEKLLSSGEKNRNANDLFTAYTGLGYAYEGLGDNNKAEEYFRKAVNFTEELRSSLAKPERQTFFDVRINGFYRAAPYEGLARVLTKMQKPEEAFKGSEYTKARVFAEGIARASAASAMGGVPADVIKNDERIIDQLAALKKARQKADDKDNELVLKSLNAQIDELENQHRISVKTLKAQYPLFAAVKYPEPMDLAQTALRDNEWTLSYDVTNSGLIVYLTKGKQLIKALFKPIPRKELDELVRKFRQPLEAGDEGIARHMLASFDFASGKKLADILLSEVLLDLPQGTPVIIVPDDSLGVLPFEMLVLNDGGHVKTLTDKPYVSGAEFFGDRNPISYYQSVTALTLARTFGKEKKPAAKRLVMCDPIFGGDDDDRLGKMAMEKQLALVKSLPDKIMSMKTELNITFSRLPLTGDLGRSLKKLEPAATDEHNGMDAAKPVLFKKPLDSYGSMVFATHGYFGKDLPGIQEPVLVLTLVDQPKGKDGFLRMSEVMGLKLNADMVALTACQTGLGQRISGEGTMGMGRAFQFAGTRAVLMSLWSVAESSSVKLVESFFEHLKEGKSKLVALRLAREELRKHGYDHPFHWAPFILVGEVD